MRSKVDALRSLKKYVASVFDGEQPSWEVRYWFDRGEIPEGRPHARVELVGGSGMTGPAWWTETQQPFSVECLPYYDLDTDLSFSAAQFEAGRVEDKLARAFVGAGVDVGRPKRVPLWDWDGVDESATSTVRGASDYMRVVGFSTRQLPDPSEPRRIAVIVDLRLAWDRALDLTTLHDRLGRPVQGSVTVTEVLVSQEPA